MNETSGEFACGLVATYYTSGTACAQGETVGGNDLGNHPDTSSASYYPQDSPHR